MDYEHCPTPGYNHESSSPDPEDLLDEVQQQGWQPECVRYHQYRLPFLTALRREDSQPAYEGEDSEMPEALLSSPNTIGDQYASGLEPEEHEVEENGSQADQQVSTDTSQEEHDNAASQRIIKELRNTIEDQQYIIEQQKRVMEAQHKTIFEHVGLILELGSAACMNDDTYRRL